jgi:putative flippase GtrA/glycosyltransferase involved in cell wall biosynthesis
MGISGMIVIRFVLVGIVNTLVGLAAIYSAMYFFRFGYLTSNAFGYGVGIILSFVLNKRWTFNNTERIAPTLVRYLLVIALAYIANLETFVFANSNMQIDPYLAQAIAVFPYTLIVFAGSRYFAFRETPALSTESASMPYTDIPLAYPSIALRTAKLSIIAPCCNEEATLPESVPRLVGLANKLINKGIITSDSRVYYVDDGSSDKTWDLIELLAAKYQCLHGIKLLRNQGYQNALLAGLFNASGEIAIGGISTHLQEGDFPAIGRMIRLYSAGHDIVYGVRRTRTRTTDRPFQRFAVGIYYRLLHILGAESIFRHTDYLLLSRRAIETLKQFGEIDSFLKAIPRLGLNSSLMYYERFADESSYPFWKMLTLTWQGFTSLSFLSFTPLRVITVIGLLVSTASFAAMLWIFWKMTFANEAISDWASTVLPVYFLGGIQLFSLGIIGEYLARLYVDTKRRPCFCIEKMVSKDNDQVPISRADSDQIRRSEIQMNQVTDMGVE